MPILSPILIVNCKNNMYTAVCKKKKKRKKQHCDGMIRIKWNLMHRQLVLVQIDVKIFKAKIKKCPESIFGVATMHCNKFCYMVWHGVRFWMFDCRREFHIAFMHSQSSYIENCRMQIMSEMPTNQIPHMLNRRHVWWISRPWKKLHSLGWTEVFNVFGTCACALSYWKVAPGMS